jgi:4-carboxymuconolactone decarboxylase
MAGEREPGGPVESAGAARRRRAQGRKADGLQRALVELDADLGRWADDFVFGEVWAPGPLGFDEQMLVAIVALAATGRHRQLRNYLHGALQEGCDPARLTQALRMLAVYVGFPAAIEALSELRDVLAAHRRRT